MDPMTIGIVALAGVLALIMMRVPIAVALIFVSFVGIWGVVGERPALSLLSTVPYTFAASWTLSSVPMFLFMGYVAYHSGLTRGMFDGARAWLGWMPGGLAIASLAGAGGFAAVTGSSIACSAAIGRIAVPEMHRQGYDIRIATGSVAAGGTIGANLFTRLVALSGLSRAIGTGIEGLGLGVLGLLILITLIYLALGMFLEPIGAMLLTLPLFLPLIEAHGVNVIWFGVRLAKLLEIGMITPPVGLNVFVIHSVAKDLVKLEQIFAGILPFLAADVLLVIGMLATHGVF